MPDPWLGSRTIFTPETSKALAIAEHKNKEFTMKLAAEDRGRKSAKAGLKNA